MDEGVIKFSAEHRHEALDARRYGDLVCQLIAWREILGLTGLVSRDPALYGGFGYGNVSVRTGAPAAPRRRRPFLITGTQTSGKRCMSLSDFCLVHGCDPERNQVQSTGETLPSSESMTHGAVYALGSHIRWVFHAHSAVLWTRAKELRLPTTDPQVAYGTPAMAREVERLYRSSNLSERRIFAMGGHEDGIVVFGKSADEAGQVLLSHLARAYASACGEQSGLCGR